MRGDLLFWRAGAAVLALVAALGFALVARATPAPAGSLVSFETPENVLHAALAALALVFATGMIREGASRAWAGWTGVALLAIAVLGFLSGRLFGLGPLVHERLETSEDLLHLALGAWGARVGFGD